MEKNCKTCKFSGWSSLNDPCATCLRNSTVELPGWTPVEPKQPAEPFLWVSNYSMPGTPSLDELDAENSRLGREIERLENENKRLKEELQKAKSVKWYEIIDESFLYNEVVYVKKEKLDEAEAENKRRGELYLSTLDRLAHERERSARLRDVLEETALENDSLKTTIRKARKLLRVKPAGFDGDAHKYVIEARKVLKDALNALKGDDIDQP